MGIDVKWCLNPNLVQDGHYCSICHDIFEDPKQSVICGHTFCAKCINTWLFLGHDSCPLDRKPYLRFNLKRDTSMNESLMCLQFKCRKTSCSFNGPISDVVIHEKSCYNPFINCKVNGNLGNQLLSYRKRLRSLLPVSNEFLRQDALASVQLLRNLNIDTVQSTNRPSNSIGRSISNIRSSPQVFNHEPNQLAVLIVPEDATDSDNFIIRGMDDDDDDGPPSRTRIIIEGSNLRGGFMDGVPFRGIFGRTTHGWQLLQCWSSPNCSRILILFFMMILFFVLVYFHRRDATEYRFDDIDDFSCGT